jgi:hypothetical protein
MAHANKLELNARRRPITSALNPQSAAPTSRPTWDANGIPAICALGLPYSCTTAGFAIDWQTIRSYLISKSSSKFFCHNSPSPQHIQNH